MATTSVLRIDLTDEQHALLMWALGYGAGRLDESEDPARREHALQLYALARVCMGATDVTVQHIDGEDFLLPKESR